MWTYRGDETTVRQWLTAIRQGHEGHRLAARWGRRRHRLVGALTTALAVLTAACAGAALLGDGDVWIQAATGGLAGAAAASAFLHTLLDDVDVTIAHQRAAADYADVRRQLEQAILSERITDDRLAQLREAWTRAENAAPSLTGRAARSAARRVADVEAPTPALAPPATEALERVSDVDEPVRELTAG